MDPITGEFECSILVGIFLTVEAGCLSFIATLSVLVFAGYRYIKWKINVKKGRKITGRPLDATDSSLFLNLMVFDLIQSLGVAPSILWFKDKMINPPPMSSPHQVALHASLCSLQGALKHIGEVGVAVTSLALAVDGFTIIALNIRPHRLRPRIILVCIWIIVALVTIIPNVIAQREKGGLYRNTKYWCWIRNDWQTMQLMAQYFWVWLSGFLMLIFYGLLFLVVKGWVVLEGRRLRWYTRSKVFKFIQQHELSEADRKLKEIANLMLFYPAVYVICILPNSVVRWLRPHKPDIPIAVIFFGNTLYTLSGLFNALLFLGTRPNILKTPKITLSGGGREFESMPFVSGTDCQLGYLPSMFPSHSRERSLHGSSEGGVLDLKDLTLPSESAVREATV